MARTSTYDPMEKFRFVVDIQLPKPGDASGGSNSPTRLGFHDIQMPKRTTNKIMYREGHNPDISSISAGLNTMEDVVMSRGAIAADGASPNDFYKWISTVYNPSTGIKPYASTGEDNFDLGAGNGGSINYRGQVKITMLDRSGTPARAWILYNAFPTHFVPGSDLSASEDGDKSLEALTLAYEDFQELQVTNGVVQTTALNGLV